MGSDPIYLAPANEPAETGTLSAAGARGGSQRQACCYRHVGVVALEHHFIASEHEISWRREALIVLPEPLHHRQILAAIDAENSLVQAEERALGRRGGAGRSTAQCR